jgi:predicted enzyme related to lactoylglutathione lyase
VPSDTGKEVRVEQPLITWAEVTLDYCDTERAANFWSAVLDLPARTQTQEGWFQLGPTAVGGPVINIQPVAEEKRGKSRAHLDLWVDDLSSAVGLVERLGGRTLEEHTYGPWIIRVMSDPEGVEFCLVGGPPADQPGPA